MKALLFLSLFLLTADTVLAQPFPVPQDQSAGPAVTYDAQGGKYETYKTPSGWVTYGPGGERFDTLKKPDGGSVMDGPGGKKVETFPGLVTSPPPTMPPSRE